MEFDVSAFLAQQSKSCVHIPVGTMLLFSVYFIYVIFGGKIMLPAGTVLFVHNVFKTNWKQKI